ncbi:MAG TPA: UPF0175 family protein [Pirellulales bacterium]|nr:UPF0175 family protein [Pirellulales bacterium]
MSHSITARMDKRWKAGELRKLPPHQRDVILATAAEQAEMSPSGFLREMRLAAAMHWYARGTISQEKAAEVAALDRTDFLMALARERIPAFHVDLDQLREEIDRG